MKIRCKKCFKKYDDYSGECPRCGHVNDRTYDDKSTEVETKKSISLEKLKHRIFKWRHHFFGGKSCAFCGWDVFSEYSNCPYCKSSFEKAEVRSRDENQLLENMAIDALKNTKVMVNFSQFSEELKEAEFLLENWHSPFNFKFGHRYGIKLIFSFISTVTVFLILATGGNVFLWLVICLLFCVGGLLANNHLLHEHLVFDKKVNHDDVSIYYYSNQYQGRYNERLKNETNTKYLKHIKITLNHEDAIEKLLFVSDDQVSFKNRMFEVDVRNYNNSSYIPLFFMLFTLKNDIQLFVERLHSKIDVETDTTQEHQNNKVEPLIFVRLDKKVPGQIVSDQDLKDHMLYLNKLAGETLFLGGGFNEGGMIIFEAIDESEAKNISDGDPIIERGMYIYELKVWDVKLTSQELVYFIRGKNGN